MFAVLQLASVREERIAGIEYNSVGPFKFCFATVQLDKETFTPYIAVNVPG